jgi:hypothetical protein
MTTTNVSTARGTVAQVLASLLVLQQTRHLPDVVGMDAGTRNYIASVYLDADAFPAWADALGIEENARYLYTYPDRAPLGGGSTTVLGWSVTLHYTGTDAAPVELSAETVAELEQIAAPKPPAPTPAPGVDEPFERRRVRVEILAHTNSQMWGPRLKVSVPSWNTYGPPLLLEDVPAEVWTQPVGTTVTAMLDVKYGEPHFSEWEWTTTPAETPAAPTEVSSEATAHTAVDAWTCSCGWKVDGFTAPEIAAEKLREKHLIPANAAVTA